jgi:hypothetical protein
MALEERLEEVGGVPSPPPERAGVELALVAGREELVERPPEAARAGAERLTVVAVVVTTGLVGAAAGGALVAGAGAGLATSGVTTGGSAGLATGAPGVAAAAPAGWAAGAPAAAVGFAAVAGFAEDVGFAAAVGLVPLARLALVLEGRERGVAMAGRDAGEGGRRPGGMIGGSDPGLSRPATSGR